MAFFVDASGSLENVRRTPQGGLLVDATVARVGILEYYDGAKVVRRYNPPSVLQSIEGLDVAPVTNRHPKKFVDTSNYGKHAAGHVVGQWRFEDGHLKATLAIQDAKLIRDIEDGAAREVSLGYMAEHDGKPGVTEAGESYDEARTRVAVNHVAIVPAGRAGKTVRLMLDSEEIPEERMLRIGENEIQVDEAQAAFDAYDARLQAQIADLTKACEDAQAQLVTAKAELAVATSDETFQARLKSYLDEEKAKLDKLAKRERVAKAYPTISLDGRSDDFIDALDLRIEADSTKKANDGLETVQSNVVVPVAPTKKAPVKVDLAKQYADELVRRSREPLRSQSE